MVFAQLLVASPFVAGFTRAAVDLLDPVVWVKLVGQGAQVETHSRYGRRALRHLTDR